VGFVVDRYEVCLMWCRSGHCMLYAIRQGRFLALQMLLFEIASSGTHKDLETVGTSI
jgi:hypothetical protein